MFALLDRIYKGWKVVKRDVSPMTFDAERDGKPVKVISACVTYAIMKQ